MDTIPTENDDNEENKDANEADDIDVVKLELEKVNEKEELTPISPDIIVITSTQIYEQIQEF